MVTLAVLRIRAGFETQEALASKMNTGPMNISRWERGERIPRPAMVAQLAEALGCNVSDIYAAITQAREAAGKAG